MRRDPAAQGGFTLIEMTVALVIVVVAVTLACDLLADSGRVLHHAVARARDPWTLLAGELLRNDLRGAALPACVVPWCEDSLSLSIPGAITATWSRDARGILWRQVGSSPGRPVLSGVTRFRWQVLLNAAVEVEATLHTSTPYLKDLAGALPQLDAGKDVRLHWLVVTRGGAQEW